ncbi:MAG: PP2C family protein-serine/threonine phosphatase [Bacteroidota bacterium]
MACASLFRWTSAACSDVGLVREINEDSCLDEPARGLWAVADGMGGHTLGDFASQMVVDHLRRLDESPDNPGDRVEAARQRLQAVNWRLREEAASREVRIIGSTVVVLLACDPFCAYLWAGDSRLYLYRGGLLRQLTRDHNQFEEFKARGDVDPDEFLDFPVRNLITRAVGAVDTLTLDHQTIAVNDGDMFLLCSDGLSNEVSDAEMSHVLLTGNCRQAAESLVDMALRQGGRDNISAIVVRAEDPDSLDRTMVNPAL